MTHREVVLIGLALAALLAAGCAGQPAPPTRAPETDRELRRTPSITVTDRMISNRLVSSGYSISLPPGWRAFLPRLGADRRVELDLRNPDDETSRGSYAVLSFDAPVTAADVSYSYVATRFDDWYVREMSVLDEKRATDGYLIIATNSRSGVEEAVISYVVARGPAVHLVEFIIPFTEQAVDLIRSYVEPSLGRGSLTAAARLIAGEGGFVSSGSGFVWRSDTTEGFVLSGTLAGYQVAVFVSFTDRSNRPATTEPGYRLDTTIEGAAVELEFVQLGDHGRRALRSIVRHPKSPQRRLPAIDIVVDAADYDPESIVHDPRLRMLIESEIILLSEEVR